MKSQPSESEIKEFWESCGFKQLEPGRGGYHYQNTKKVWNWLPPSEVERHKSIPFLPSINLDSLFKYAVPNVIDKIMAEGGCSSDVAYEILFKKWLQELQLNIPHATLALFWVLSEL